MGSGCSCGIGSASLDGTGSGFLGGIGTGVFEGAGIGIGWPGGGTGKGVLLGTGMGVLEGTGTTLSGNEPDWVGGVSGTNPGGKRSEEIGMTGVPSAEEVTGGMNWSIGTKG